MNLLDGYLLAISIGDAIAKKVAQGEDAKGSLHILAYGGARNGGDIVTRQVGHIFEDEGTQE